MHFKRHKHQLLFLRLHKIHFEIFSLPGVLFRNFFLNLQQKKKNVLIFLQGDNTVIATIFMMLNLFHTSFFLSVSNSICVYYDYIYMNVCMFYFVVSVCDYLFAQAQFSLHSI